MKKCKDCHEIKPSEEFYGVQGECKQCTRARVNANRERKSDYYKAYDKWRNKTSRGRILDERYALMKRRVQGEMRRRSPGAIGKELLSKEEWGNWNQLAEVRAKFDQIYSRWVESGYDNRLSPSVDRINNQGGYTVDNMQWLTRSQNTSKYTK